MIQVYFKSQLYFDGSEGRAFISELWKKPEHKIPVLRFAFSFNGLDYLKIIVVCKIEKISINLGIPSSDSQEMMLIKK